MINPLTNHVDVVVCASSSEAIRNGYFYRSPIYLPIQLNQAVVVRNGTRGGAATIDLILEDGKGQKHVLMITQNLVKMLGDV